MKKVSYISVLFLSVFIVMLATSSCKGKKEAPEDKFEDALAGDSFDQDRAYEITITRKQFENSGMKTGKPEVKSFQQSINANGYLVAAPNGKANISSLISGRVKKINIVPGETLKKGQKLFSLEGREIIMLQQEYAESFNQLALLKNNFERNQELSKANISAKKDLLIAETEYKNMLAKTEALKSLLKMLNLNHTDIESGSILPEINIYSPLSGYVTELKIEAGEYVEPGKTLVQLIDPAELKLDIFVFKQDIETLSPGQNVNFYDPDYQDKKYKAVLSSIGKTVDMESRTIKCSATINPKDRTSLIHNAFIEAEVVTCTREAVSLPASCLKEEDGRYYVLIKVEEKEDLYVFRKTLVNIGVVQGDIAEVLDEGLSDILISGAFNLFDN